MPFRTRRARFAPILVLALLSLVGAALIRPAVADPPVVATKIVITSATTPQNVIPVPDTDGAPASFIVAGVAFTIGVKFTADDETTLLPISTTKETTLRVTVDGDPKTIIGSAVVPASATTASITGVTLKQALNGVKLTVAGFEKNSNKPVAGLASDTTDPIDVQKDFLTAASTATQVSIGAGGGLNKTCQPTVAEPTCAELYLSKGANSSQVLSLGSCVGFGKTPTDDTKCNNVKQSVVQALFDVDGKGYGTTTPIVVILKCDKSLCGQLSPNKVPVFVSFNPADDLSLVPAAPPCPAKGTLPPAPQDVCVDDVQSKKDNSGDIWRFILLRHDVRKWFG